MQAPLRGNPLDWLRTFFSTSARQAAGWVALGIAGVLLFGGGALLLLRGGGEGSAASPDDGATTATVAVRATATPTPRPSVTASPSASPTATATPSPSPEPTATRVNTNQGNQGNQAPQPTATPTATPTETPEPTATPTPIPGAYCQPGVPTPPDLRVAGSLTISGAPAPVGTNVTLLFDGAAGPSRPTTEIGVYRVDTYIGSASCRNHPGAAISVFVNGVAYPTGATLGSTDMVLGFNVAAP